MIKLVIRYQEENDFRTYEWEQNLVNFYVTNDQSLAGAVNMAKNEFIQTHPHAFFFTMRLEFGVEEYVKRNGEFKHI